MYVNLSLKPQHVSQNINRAQDYPSGLHWPLLDLQDIIPLQAAHTNTTLASFLRWGRCYFWRWSAGSGHAGLREWSPGLLTRVTPFSLPPWALARSLMRWMKILILFCDTYKRCHIESTGMRLVPRKPELTASFRHLPKHLAQYWAGEKTTVECLLRSGLFLEPLPGLPTPPTSPPPIPFPSKPPK